MSIQITVNSKLVAIRAESDTPLLWVLREELGLTGTKFGCGIGACGACSVHIDGEIARSCSLPIAAVAGKSVVTIEALGSNDAPHPLQVAWSSIRCRNAGIANPAN